MASSSPQPAGRSTSGEHTGSGEHRGSGEHGQAAAARPPFPVEVALADGTVLRGIEHPADGPPLLFVHDLGEDLDVWRQVAPAVRAAGFRVICLELRGCGLSDGEPDPAATRDDLVGALAEVGGAFGPVGLVAHGAAARAAFSLGADQGAPVHAAISPMPAAGDDTVGGILNGGDGDAEAAAAMRVLFSGAHDELAHGYVGAIHSGLRGQNMWISTGTVLRGPALLREHPHLIEQLVMFMRRHLTAHHLAWIAQHSPNPQDSAT